MSYGVPTRTVAEVKRAVTRQFGDESGVQIETADLYGWINDAQDEIVKRNRILKATSTGSSVIGQAAYSFPSDNILQVESIHYNGERLRNMPFAQAEESLINASNSAETGEPILWYEWGGSFTFWPTPPTVQSFTIYYTMSPARITQDTDLLSVPDKYYQDVVRYALQQAYEMDEDWTASQAKAQQFTDSLNDMAEEERTAQNMTYSRVTVVD